MIFSLPKDWDFSEKGLEAICKDGITVVRTALKEMEEYGYLVRSRIYVDGKISDWKYDFFEVPKLENLKLENLSLENLSLENTHNKVKTDEVKTDEVKSSSGKHQLFDYVSNSSYKENIKEILTIWLREVGLTKIRSLSIDTFKKKVEEVITEVGEDNAYEVFEYSVMGGYPNFYTDRVKKNSNTNNNNTKNNVGVKVNSIFMTSDEFYGAKEFI